MKLTLATHLASLVLAGFAVAQLPPKNGEIKDPVTDLLRSAMQKYQKADLNGTSEDLEAARKLVDARRGDRASTLLPTVPGWTGTKAEKQDSGILGGSSAWRRSYENKDKPEKTVKAELVLDSPLLGQLTPLLTNPAIAKATGFEIRRVEGRDALIKPIGDGMELNVWIGSGILFKLTAAHMKENEVVVFTKNFDLKEMEKLKKDGALDKK
jgi:hypothetical protein